MEWTKKLSAIGAFASIRERDGSELYVFFDASEATFDALSRLALDAGFSAGDAYEAGVRFALFRRGEQEAILSYSEADRRASLVLREQAPFPVFAGKPVCAPLLTQIYQPYYCSDCGMGYLFRTSAGRFVVIDGGEGLYEYAEETTHLLELITEQNPHGGKPEIAAWFISHTHEDHFGVLLEYLEKYADACRLDCVVYNAAPAACTASCSAKSDPALLENALKKANVPCFVPSSGCRFCVDDLTLEIVCTWEDHFPAFMQYFNDTSLVVKAAAGKYRVFLPGDAMKPTADLLCRRFDPAYFACDFLQVAHHGYWGGSAALFDAVNASAVLWPAPDFQFLRMRDLDYNKPLINDRTRDRVFFAWRGDDTFDLTRPIPNAKAEPTPADGIVRDERFTCKTLPETHLNCLTCGGSGYEAAVPRLSPGRLRLETQGDAFAVLELARPGQMQGADAFTLTISGSCEAAEKLGFFFDYDTPMHMDEDRALWFDPVPGAFLWRLERRNDAVRLFFGDTLVQERPAGAAQGLYLIFRHAILTLTGIRIEVRI